MCCGVGFGLDDPVVVCFGVGLGEGTGFAVGAGVGSEDAMVGFSMATILPEVGAGVGKATPRPPVNPPDAD